MKSHELAKHLLASPDVPVVVSDDRTLYEVVLVTEEQSLVFNGAHDTPKTKRGRLGYNLKRPAICLMLCDSTPPSKKELKRKSDYCKKIESDRKRLSPQAFNLMYATIRPMTVSDFESQFNKEAGK